MALIEPNMRVITEQNYSEKYGQTPNVMCFYRRTGNVRFSRSCYPIWQTWIQDMLMIFTLNINLLNSWYKSKLSEVISEYMIKNFENIQTYLFGWTKLPF